MPRSAKKLKFAVAVLTLVTTLETGWIGISQTGLLQIKSTRLRPNTSREFYYPEVLQDPAKSLNHLGTAQFRALKESTGLEKYISYYRRTNAIDRISLVRHNEEPDLFEVSFDRTLENGRVKKGKTVFGLECVNVWQAIYRRCIARLRTSGSHTVRKFQRYRSSILPCNGPQKTPPIRSTPQAPIPHRASD